MIHAMEKWKYGIEIGGKCYNNLRYEDDVAFMAMTDDNVQQLLNYFGKPSGRFVLSLNAKKTQFIVIDRHTYIINIIYNGAPWNKSNSSFTWV